MRDWDKEEREFENKPMPRRDPKDHVDHNFDPITGICAICLKTREQLRREW